MAIEFFSSPDCGYCEKAKALLKGKGVAFSDLDIVADQASRDEFARRLPRTRSLPQIFVDGRHIGGYEDLLHLESEGKLDGLLVRTSSKE